MTDRDAQNASTEIIWLHGDHLSAENPALTRYPNAPVIFVFDAPFLRESQFSFHRLFFLYESVLDVLAQRNAIGSVRVGNVVEEVLAFVAEQRATRVITTETVGSRFAAYKQELEKHLPLRAIAVPQLVPYPDVARVPKRFSAWWREVEEDALR